MNEGKGPLYDALFALKCGVGVHEVIPELIAALDARYKPEPAEPAIDAGHGEPYTADRRERLGQLVYDEERAQRRGPDLPHEWCLLTERARETRRSIGERLYRAGYNAAERERPEHRFVETMADQRKIDDQAREAANKIVAERKLETQHEAERFAAAWIGQAMQESRNVEYMTKERDALAAQLADVVDSRRDKERALKIVEQQRDQAEYDLSDARDQLCKVEDEFREYRRTSVSVEELPEAKPDSFWRSRCAKLEQSLADAHRELATTKAIRPPAVPDAVMQVMQNIAAPRGEGPYVPYNPTSRERQTVRKWLDASFGDDLMFTRCAVHGGASGIRADVSTERPRSAAGTEAALAGVKVANEQLKAEIEAVRERDRETTSRISYIAEAIGLARFGGAYNEENVLPRVKRFVEVVDAARAYRVALAAALHWTSARPSCAWTTPSPRWTGRSLSRSQGGDDADPRPQRHGARPAGRSRPARPSRRPTQRGDGRRSARRGRRRTRSCEPAGRSGGKTRGQARSREAYR